MKKIQKGCGGPGMAIMPGLSGIAILGRALFGTMQYRVLYRLLTICKKCCSLITLERISYRLNKKRIVFWSASVDTRSGKKDVLLKVANKNATPETVKITLKGVEKVQPQGYSTTLTAPLDSENSIANPNNVVPRSGSFTASGNFSYTFPAYSITALRINILDSK